MIDPEIEKRVQVWIEGPFDLETKAAIQLLLQSNPKELEGAFFKDLSFGTGGMRGVMGIGTNRMNIYTVRTATQGLANYLKKEPQESHSVFIGYDVREHSRQFAEETAKVFAGNGMTVYISREICPTPLVSFACRHFHCSAAVMITASHNPPQYNGYKVYWSDGGQVVEPHDTGIIDEVHLVQKIELDSIDSPRIQWVGKELDKAYFKALQTLQFHPKEETKPLEILYTNLHGTGIRIIPEALKQWGFSSVKLVASQAAPDGAFPNAPSPNPEEASALRLGMEELLKEEGDLLLATDPDADRMGIAVRHNQEVIRMSGNQIACLCLHHICTQLTEQKMFPPNAGFIKTIVTTELFKKIATSFGGICIDTLTGFKYIAEQIRIWETSFGGLQYLFGAEESYGYLFGTFVRDKDAISSCCLISEVAAEAKGKGLTLVDQLHELYRIYGIHREAQSSLNFSDTQEGMEKTAAVMKQIRTHLPSKIGNLEITSIEDYQTDAGPLPKSDVIRFWLSDGSKLVIRPSGTEPKIKIYAEVVVDSTNSIESADLRLQELIAIAKMDPHRFAPLAPAREVLD